MENINLLTAEYKAKAEFHKETRIIITAAAVIFLLCILIVTVSISIISLMELQINRNELALADPSAKEAERLNRLAMEATEASARFSFPQNISVDYFPAVAAEANGVSITGLLLDNPERRISVSGFAATEELLTDFIARLNERSYFTEIIVAELEYRENAFYFLLTLNLGGKL